MEIQLINGQFNAIEAIGIITEMVQVKIKYHENKIKESHNEEDIKMRERKIKALQNQLSISRDYINKNSENIIINSTINL